MSNTENSGMDKNMMDEMMRYGKEKSLADSRNIHLRAFAGDLATLGRPSSKVAGYPIGSVCPFVIDHTGQPVIYISDIAEHSRNALDNGKASIIVREIEKNHHIETGWRLTYVGDLIKVPEPEKERVANHYFRHYPTSKIYINVHGFEFWRLHVKAARVIMGFGKIAWVDAEALCLPSSLDENTEHSIIEHMNGGHLKAINHYLTTLGVTIEPNTKDPKMVGVNQFGVTLSYRKRLYFLPFEVEANDANAIREQLVKLAK